MNPLERYNTIFRGQSSNFPTAGGAGQAFNKIDQYAFVADNGDLDVKAAVDDGKNFFCFGGYIKTGVDITSAQYVVGKNVASTSAYRYGFTISASVLGFTFVTSTGLITIAKPSISANTEYHAVACFDLTNSKVYLYVDNVLVNSGGTLFAGTFNNPGNEFEFYLGAGNNADGSSVVNYFGGELRDIRIYHKDIISQLPKWINNKGLGNEIAWWNLPTLTGFGGTSYDLTGVNL